ncbi:MAG: alpha/beta hydrolase [Xanthobacteraceae bacterium]|nr:alpha/beta hydrolase [Xanthobacteraceae bacterium]
MAVESKPCKIDAGSAGRVSGLLTTPAEPLACYVFAHGAGAGMRHPFMEQVAQGLAERGVATLRYQFAYMEHGSKRPDPPKLAHAVVRAAVAQAAELVPGVAMFAGGKSFGGRMTSQAQALAPMANVLGLGFFGFPLHPAGKPSDERGKHLFDVAIPMLFLQGTRDALAERRLLEPLVRKLDDRATLELLPDADHSFHVPARSGQTDKETLSVALDAFATWSAAIGKRR